MDFEPILSFGPNLPVCTRLSKMTHY